jgi:hypothetical protein
MKKIMIVVGNIPLRPWRFPLRLADHLFIRSRKMNRSEVSSKWNKCRIYVGDQLDRWNELKEVLRIQTRAEVAKILLF